VRSQLTWTHYRILMRLPEEQREFYERGAIAGRWSSRELERQINSLLAERTVMSRKPLETMQRALAERPLLEGEVFKNPYILDFLGLQEPYNERDLEEALVRHIEKFLLELGTGFAFMGRQKRLTLDGVDYYVDLVFFHRKLRAQVFVDLKMGKLAPADVSQMKLYINWARKYDKEEWENDPIGLILCGSQSSQVIELLLSDSTDSTDQRIKVAQYLLLDAQETLKEHLAQMSVAWEEAREHPAE
jgi:predicted nuclease of restriction endonuclease-like (RecB) superfamily